MPTQSTSDSSPSILDWLRSFASATRIVTVATLLSTITPCVLAPPVSAAITLTGVSTTPSYTGADPWTIQGNLTVGGFTFPGNDPGVLIIDNGSVINNASGFVGGTSSLASAVVLVTGAGSQWNNTDNLNVGAYLFGTGELNIEDQAVVNVGLSTIVGSSIFARVINFDGGVLNTGHLSASPQELLGSGTINTGTILSDIDLVFDSAHGLQQQYMLNSEPGQSVSINIDATNVLANLVTGAGYRGAGSLSISDGISLASNEGILGYRMGSQGTATVSGVGSQWDLRDNLYVGYEGAGALTIQDAAVVNVGLDTTLGQTSTASGAITFDGGTLSTGGLFASGEHLTGTGTINTRGIVSDIDLVFDLAHGLQQQVLLAAAPDKNIAINLNVTDPTKNRALGVGHGGNGSLTILDGLSISSTQGMLGYQSGSNGVATVSGAGSRWINRDTLTVGNYGTGTLGIDSGGAVESIDGYIGYQTGSSGSVTVSGQDSQWVNSDSLYAGYRGDGNLSILEGGFVQSNVGHLGYSANSSGTATVSGTDSFWRIRQGLTVGRAGLGNLVVQDGGHVLVDYYTPYTHTGVIGDEPGTSGTVTVAGVGTVLDYRCRLNIGDAGTGTMDIQNGGQLVSYSGYLGNETDGVGTIQVTGAGSSWDNKASIYVGNSGSGALSILNGAAANSGAHASLAASIGENAGAVGTVTVDGLGSRWSLDGMLYVANKGTGTLNIGNNAVVDVAGNTFIELESSSNGMINFDNGTLNTLNLFASPINMAGTGTINAKGAVSDVEIRFDQASGLSPQVNINTLINQNIALNIEASDTSVSNILGAGFRGFGSLSITEGVSVNTYQGMLGYHSGSQGTATVTGTGSAWIIRDELVVGRKGLGVLDIRDGGFLQSDDEAVYIGEEVGAFGRVNLNGADSSWETHDLYIGRRGSGTVNIRDGATINSYLPYFGYESGSYGMATIIGEGSSWDASSLHVGWDGTGMLAIEQGAVVTASLYLGHNPGSYGEAALTGASSILPRSVSAYYPDLSVGVAGTGVLNIEQGSLVKNATFSIGSWAGGIGVATITDPGTQLDSIHGGYVGDEGSGVLNILNGATVNGNGINIAQEPGSTGRVSVSGTGSLLSIQKNLTVGNLGDGRLHIEDNAIVQIGEDTWVRKDPAATGSIHFNNGTLNTAGLVASKTELLGAGTINTGTIVSDVDLVFDQNSGLQQQLTLNTLSGQNITLNVNPGSDPASNRAMGLGYYGNGSMTLADGLSLMSTEGILGYYGGSTGSAMISGAGTEWINSGDMTIGKGGMGTLQIIDGAVVQNSKGYVSAEPGASGSVIVSGTGSLWDNTSHLCVGCEAPGILVIENGGQVNSVVTSIESGNSETPSSITITGSGSQLNAQRIWVGSAYNPQLNVLAGAVITKPVQYGNSVIGGSSGNSGTVNVSGAGSIWHDSGLTVGNYGSGTLNISDGGIVALDYQSSSSASIGSREGSSGVVSVEGDGSAWNIASILDVGEYGSGILNIENNAQVTALNEVWVGKYESGVGVINLNNGVLNTTVLYASPTELYGTGTINTANIISDIDLLFDQAHGLQQQVVLNNEPDQNITIKFDYSDPASNTILGAGYRGVGSMIIADGLKVSSNNGILGHHNGSDGSASVVGSGSQWLIVDELVIGRNGVGSIAIQEGGFVQSTNTFIGHENGSGGSVIISGNGSQLDTELLRLGLRDSVNSITVQDGGWLTTNYANVGHQFDSTSRVSVSGIGSRWDTSEGMIIGYDATGYLLIEHGGVVTSGGHSTIASQQFSIGEVTVTDPSSRLSINGILTIRGNSSNALNIRNAGIVESGAVYVGAYTSTFYTTINIHDAGSQWIVNGPLRAGNNGNAEINIHEGGLIDTQELSVGYTQNTKAIINQDGGTVRLNAGNLLLANASRSEGTYNLNAGTLDLQGHNILVGIGPVHQFNFNGGILKHADLVSLGQPFNQQGGTLAPGGSIGQTDIVGDYNLIAGTLEIELGGVGNLHDVVTATGDIDIATVGTTLDLSPLGTMAAGAYAVIQSTSGSVTGMFEYVTGIGLYPGLVDLSYTSNAVLITLNWDYVPGDLDGDGFVGITDLNTVLGHWNQSVPAWDLLSGDVTGDGFVGIEDLDSVLGNWNTGILPTVLSEIPEPSVLSTMLVGWTMMSRRAAQSRFTPPSAD